MINKKSALSKLFMQYRQQNEKFLHGSDGTGLPIHVTTVTESSTDPPAVPIPST